MALQTATFAAGCFWGVEAAFCQVEGVVDVTVGYTGGHIENPSHEEVEYGHTGHAMAARVTYDDSLVAFGDLLSTFWRCHDPTQLNRQGPDVGSQYRSAIFWHTPEQRDEAIASRDLLNRTLRFRRMVVTRVERADRFYPADPYHQQYLSRRGQTTCASTLRT